MSEKTQALRKWDRVRATVDIRMPEYPFCDIRAGMVGLVVDRYTPEKAKSCWNIVIKFDEANYLVMLAYPTSKLEKVEDIFLPVT